MQPIKIWGPLGAKTSNWESGTHQALDTALANVVTVGSYEALYLGLCVIHNYVINTLFFIYIYDYEVIQENQYFAIVVVIE